MSMWTHVNGSLRIDCLDGDIHTMFHTFAWPATREERNACNVPRGSEESLQVSIWTNPVIGSDGDSRQYVLTVFGDLRDYEDEDAIVAWINKIIVDHDMFIRDGVMTINDSVYRYHEKYDECGEDWTVVDRGFRLVYKE